MTEYGLCGEKLSHSYSEIIHNMLGNDKYKLLGMSKEDFYRFMTDKNFKAVNVTIPYKTDAMKLCDVVSNEAKAIGSVNTVVNKNGVLYGYNTDISGFTYMLDRAGISVEGKKVLILGTGGTSLTANAACAALGAKEIVTVSRSGKVNYSNISTHSDADVIINTTPVGMYPGNGVSPVDLSMFPNLCGVADVIYNPETTRFLHEAKIRGLKTAGGLSMLVYQAVEADKLFFDKKAPADKNTVERIICVIAAGVHNITLVGMPGCGKTTVGKRLAERLGREFIDADDYITKKHGRTPGEIISSDGEPSFRDIETEALEEITKLSSKVISCGGGAPIREHNRDLIKQNSTCIYITRDTNKLSTHGRPLSAGGAEHLQKMFEVRDPIYREVADISVPLAENTEACVRSIISKLEETK